MVRGCVPESYLLKRECCLHILLKVNHIACECRVLAYGRVSFLLVFVLVALYFNMLRLLLLLLGFFGSPFHAVPISQPGAGLGVKFEKRSGSLPTLTLPDAVYQAVSYDALSDVSGTYTVIINRVA